MPAGGSPHHPKCEQPEKGRKSWLSLTEIFVLCSHTISTSKLKRRTCFSFFLGQAKYWMCASFQTETRGGQRDLHTLSMQEGYVQCAELPSEAIQRPACLVWYCWALQPCQLCLHALHGLLGALCHAVCHAEVICNFWFASSLCATSKSRSEA